MEGLKVHYLTCVCLDMSPKGKTAGLSMLDANNICISDLASTNMNHSGSGSSLGRGPIANRTRERCTKPVSIEAFIVKFLLFCYGTFIKFIM